MSGISEFRVGHACAAECDGLTTATKSIVTQFASDSPAVIFPPWPTIGGRLPNTLTRIVLVLLFCTVLAHAQQQPASAPTTAPNPNAEPTSALEAAQLYGSMFQSGQATQAVQKFWDLDSMIDGMFAEDKAKITDPQRQEIKETFKKFVDALYTDRRLTQVMAQSKFEDFQAAAPEKEVTQVTFNLAMPTGQKLPNKLFLKQVDGKWRVIDAQAGAAPLVASLNKGYAMARTQMTPVEFVHTMFDEIIAKAGGATKPATAPAGAPAAPAAASQPAP